MKRSIYIVLFLLITSAASALDRAAVIHIVEQAADSAEVPRELLVSIASVESSYTPNVPPRRDGSSLSFGTCQVHMVAATHVDKVYKLRIKATPRRLQTTYLSCFYGAKYLKLLLRQYNFNWKRAITAYNLGHATTGNSVYYQKVMVQVALYRMKTHE